MKQKELEMFLQKIPQPPNPKPSLEQYMTPATIAADIIYTACHFNDIQNKTIVDLGCGTGIFAIGAVLTNAAHVYGFDIDNDSIIAAKNFAKQQSLKINFETKEIQQVNTQCDTVLMNPPFGAQKSNIKADRKFIEKAFELSKTIYSLHLLDTKPFLEKMISSLQGKITFAKTYTFPIKWMYTFHEKQVKTYEVVLLRTIV